MSDTNLRKEAESFWNSLSEEGKERYREIGRRGGKSDLERLIEREGVDPTLPEEEAWAEILRRIDKRSRSETYNSPSE